MENKQKKTENIAEILEDPRRACKLNNENFTKNKVKKNDKYIISYIGESSLIGIEDVIKNEDVDTFTQYTSTVQCISRAEVMYLSKKDFMALKNQTNVWNFMLELQK